MQKVAIVGASGYAGAELIRIIHAHPQFDLAVVTAGSNAGALVAHVHPQFSAVPAVGNLEFLPTQPSSLFGMDLIFMALPHGESAALVSVLPSDVRIVDLGADFRLVDPNAWKKYYGGTHAGTWTYGLPELRGHRTFISQSARVANPGCYATAIQLGLAPIMNLISATDIVVVAASGTSGAGRSAKVNLLGSEVMGSMSTYKVGGTHQHTPEIEQSLSRVSGENVEINFTPMLAPMTRGILATSSARTYVSETELWETLTTAYQKEPFISVLPQGQLPVTASTYGSNAVHIQVAKDERTNRATVFVALDNLVKGAAGQAVQNTNIMFGFPETTGLSAIGVAP